VIEKAVFESPRSIERPGKKRKDKRDKKVERKEERAG
jgi:hypothetical protein